MTKGELRKPYPLINLEKKFILFTNAKCGGTTLKNWFVDSLELERTFSNPISAIRYYGFSFVFQWYRQQFLKHDIERIKKNNSILRRFIRIYREHHLEKIVHHLDDKSFYKFAIVRDPYDRLVSGFVDKFCGDDLSLDWVQAVIRENESKDENGNPAISFKQFVYYLSVNDLEDVNAHWRHQWYVLGQTQIDQLIDLKSMSVELPKLSEQFGVEMTLNLSKKRQSNTYDTNQYDTMENIFDIPNTKLIEMKSKFGGFPRKDAFYNEAIRAQVRRIYHEDFENLIYQN